MMPDSNETTRPTPPPIPEESTAQVANLCHQKLDEPLGSAHWEAIDQAHRRLKSIRLTVKIASFNAWATAIFAALAVPFVFSDRTAILVVTGLGLVSWHEFKGRRLMRQLDPQGPTVLGRNQVLFTALLIAYGVWKIVAVLHAPALYSQAQLNIFKNHPTFHKSLTSYGDLVKLMTILLYSLMIGVAALAQGLTAVYYFTRKKPLCDHLKKTPDWIIKLQKQLWK
ncbi:MAG: hypothetical protein K8S55_10235 [Phycisphaerae bacterium]|nr:hypothetical protein [Phycisphaerae bacterium]